MFQRFGNDRFIIFDWNTVGGLVGLNISDIDFEERECVVYGKETRSDVYILMLKQNYICKIT